MLNYDILWKKEYYFELRLMEYIRKTLSRLSDKTLDIIFDSASKIALDQKLNSTNDVDLHGFDLILASLQPKMLKAGFSTSPDVILSGLKAIFKINKDLFKN
ncbi:MAG: hypothetical protein ACW967_08775 [Candidatus Hodarchaeales archaeon]